jgi:hypothetical protein
MDFEGDITAIDLESSNSVDDRIYNILNRRKDYSANLMEAVGYAACENFEILDELNKYIKDRLGRAEILKEH